VSNIHYGGLLAGEMAYRKKIDELEYELRMGIISHEEFVKKYKELKQKHEDAVKESNERYWKALDEC
jgi:hypothetical protein